MPWVAARRAATARVVLAGPAPVQGSEAGARAFGDLPHAECLVAALLDQDPGNPPGAGVVDRLLAETYPPATGLHGSTLSERRFSKIGSRLLRSYR